VFAAMAALLVSWYGSGGRVIMGERAGPRILKRIFSTVRYMVPLVWAFCRPRLFRIASLSSWYSTYSLSILE